VPQRIESAATAGWIATLDLPAGIVTLPSPAAEIESGTPPTERVESGAAVPEIGSRTGFPKDYACPYLVSTLSFRSFFDAISISLQRL
jgi:hypothetical protein